MSRSILLEVNFAFRGPPVGTLVAFKVELVNLTLSQVAFAFVDNTRARTQVDAFATFFVSFRPNSAASFCSLGFVGNDATRPTYGFRMNGPTVLRPFVTVTLRTVNPVVLPFQRNITAASVAGHVLFMVSALERSRVNELCVLRSAARADLGAAPACPSCDSMLD